MHILIVNTGKIPVTNYGGTERVIWYLGKALVSMGHQVTYLVEEGSHCDFASVLFLNPAKRLAEQVPESVDLVHFQFSPNEAIEKPHLVTVHGNCNDFREFDLNTVFVSRNHAARFGSTSFVHNGLDWNDYGQPDLGNLRSYFHFLGNAAWRVKNVRGSIAVIQATRHEKLKVLGGTRLNFRMGFRLTLSPRVTFCGMVGGAAKNDLLRGSKGLIFPVRWHEPFGLAIIESLYFGCPVFGTPYGALPELVPSEVGHLSASASELARQVEDAGRYDRKKCHEYAAEHFNAQKMAQAYLEKYEQVLNGRPLNTAPPKLTALQTQKFLDWGA